MVKGAWPRRAKLLVVLLTCCMALGQIHAQPTVATPVGPRCEQEPLMRIGLITDAQYCDCDAEIGRYYRISLEKLHQSIDTLNAHKVDWVVNLGDLVDRRLESYPRAKQELARLDAPLYNVLGNHEFWDVPRGLQGSVLDSLGLGLGYCALQMRGWRMLFLDGTELAAYAQGAHEDLEAEADACQANLIGHANQAIWNGAIGQEQMAWIDRQLGEADRARERVILFCHFPISPPGHPMTLWNEADLRLLLGHHGSPEAWVAGHAHGGAYMALDSVHHLTLQGMLLTPDSNSFAIMNVYADRLVLEGFGREPARVLPLRGSLALGGSLYPLPLERPDATPPQEQTCLERTIVSPLGDRVFSEETDSLAASKLPRLAPGVYEIKELSEGRFDCRTLVVLPR